MRGGGVRGEKRVEGKVYGWKDVKLGELDGKLW